MQAIRKATTLGALTLAIVLASGGARGQADTHDSGWFARAWGGYSNLSDTGGSSDLGVASGSDGLDISLSGGFSAGAGFGYRYNRRLAVELAWEYRTNDSETVFDSGTRFGDGNYASNTFFLNGYYFLEPRGRWEPYVGAGLAWLQEVDLDLEGNGPEQSFSGDGDVGLQLFAGSNYHFSEHWSAHGELRYGSLTGIDLEGENNGGSIGDLDYQPVTLQLGLTYRF